MRWLILVLAGCGRIGFSPITGDSGGGANDARDAISSTAVTVTFGERNNATFRNVTADTFISNEAGESTLNYGSTDVLRSEQDVDERILVRFDVSALPVSAQIVSAELTINITEFFPGATLSARPLLEAWTEGTLDGAAGAANFQSRSATQAWSTIGAGSPGSSGAIVGSTTPGQLGDVDISIDPATVQSWATTPATNFGIIFFNSSTESVRFASSEDGSETQRPLLTVTYEP